MVLRRAVLAPSSHNTQPWRFRISSATIDLIADRTRALPVNDPDDRELTISCGCALFNLRVAAADGGLAIETELLPDPARPDWLARVVADSRATAWSNGRELSEYIGRRRTYRGHFAATRVSASAMAQLVDAAAAEGACLRPVERKEETREICRLVAAGDAVQWGDPRWRRELASWMHPRRAGEGLTVPGPAAPVARLAVRAIDMGRLVGAKDRALADSSPLLAILGTERDDPLGWLMAGQALQRVLLTGCKLGLQASFLNQPVQVASLRSELRRLTVTGHPQIVLRLGCPRGEIPAAPRRPLQEVLEDTASHSLPSSSPELENIPA